MVNSALVYEFCITDVSYTLLKMAEDQRRLSWKRAVSPSFKCGTTEKAFS